jgi:hypothetical protein
VLLTAAGLAVAAALLNCMVAIALGVEAANNSNGSSADNNFDKNTDYCQELNISRNSGYAVYDCGSELKIIYK